MTTHYELTAKTAINNDGDIISVHVQVFDKAGNLIEDAEYSEDVYLKSWKVTLLDHMQKYTQLYLID